MFSYQSCDAPHGAFGFKEIQPRLCPRRRRMGSGGRALPSLGTPHAHSGPFTVNVELIGKRLKAGFRPFALVTSSGDKHPVPRPGFMLLTHRTVVVADQQGYATILD